METKLNELTDELDKVDVKTAAYKYNTRGKTVPEFRLGITDALYKAIRKETARSAAFTRTADYFRAKLSEAKIESFHITLGIVIDASTVKVEEK